MALPTAGGAQHKTFAFVFGMASGHLNPSLPVARALRDLGHEVHYLCPEQFRAAIEGTGAELHVDVDVEPELFEGREPDIMGAVTSLALEHGLAGECIIQQSTKVMPIQTELRLPGLLRWLRRIRASAVMHCPLMSPEGAYGARVLGIPSVALHVLAGPGAVPHFFAELSASGFVTPEEVCDQALGFRPRTEAIERVNLAFGQELMRVRDMIRPFGKMDALRHSDMTLVTTIEELQDAAPRDLLDAYLDDGVRFEAVGPLVGREGAFRAGCHRWAADGEQHDEDEAAQAAAVLSEVVRARAAGRPVVLASMGTVLTSDSPDFGWAARRKGPDGAPRGLSGAELCRAAWGGAFDAFGRGAAAEGPLLVVALGPQPEPLGDLALPANAVSAPFVPQVDVLAAGVAAFLSHGGQNSFTESLAAGAPLVVCPGFGDQPANAAKAEALGVGLRVPRPDPDAGGEAAAVAAYRVEVSTALRRVASEAGFATVAGRFAGRLRQAGGVKRAVDVMLAAASRAEAAPDGGRLRQARGVKRAVGAMLSAASQAEVEDGCAATAE